MIKKLKQWVKDNKRICYSVVLVCFLIINGLFMYGTAGSGSKSILAVAGLCAFFLCILCAFDTIFRNRNNYIPRIFLVVLLSLGTMYSILFQPGTAPDETYHFQCSYKYSDYLLLKKPTADSMAIRIVDVDMLEQMSGNNRLSYSRFTAIADDFELHASSSEELSIQPQSAFSLGSNPPQLKISSAIGITIARLLGLGCYPLFYLGRLFNFLPFAFLVYFAVKLTPVCRNAFMAIALLPMTLHISSSYSYDAGIIGLSLFLIAFCLKAIYSSEKLSLMHRIAIAVTALLLAPCKVIYALLILMVFLIPQKVFASKSAAVFYKIGVPLFSLGMLLLLRLSSMLNLAGIGSTTGANQTVGGSGQVQFHSIYEFFSDPINTGRIFLDTLNAKGDFYFTSTIGGSLGWFQPELVSPWFIVMAFAILLLLAFLKTPDSGPIAPFVHKLVYTGIFCLGFFATMLSMFFGHTAQQGTIIEGVQGRYLLPFLPMLALVIQNSIIESKKSLRLIILFGMLTLNLAYLTRLYAISTMIVQ